MHAIKKLLLIGILSALFIVVVVVLYIASPHTYTKDISPGYSDRYYELLNKGALTEEERNEFLKEKEAADAAAVKEYKSKYLDNKEE